MLTPSPADQSSQASKQAAVRAIASPAAFRPFEPQGPPATWNRGTCLALLALVAVWAAKLYSTWGAWGNLTIDSGHEMYIPALLARGKMLYRDVWFMYGPAAPYFNSWLYAMFGERLDVLYWAGSLSALGSAIFLFFSGMRLSSPLLGWTAGAVVILEAFQPTLFCFPLAYSFSTVYACLVGCLFLWLIIRASTSESWGWVFAAATAAALALQLKPEFGTACYSTLALLLLAQCLVQQSWKPALRGVLASLPGVLASVLVVLWMISIRGIEFITQENIVSWPTSYFMKTYGKMWLERNGFTISGPAFYDAAFRAIPLVGAAGITFSFLWWDRSDRRSKWLRAMLVVAWLLNFVVKGYLPVTWQEFREVVLTPVFFPLDMVLYVAAAAVLSWWHFWRQPGPGRNPVIPLLLSYSSLLAFRLLMNMNANEYPIYYNGPVVLSFLFLISLVFTGSGRSPRLALVSQALICMACLTVVFHSARAVEARTKDYVPLITERGTVRVPPNLARNYKVAIGFMKQKAAQGESVLSIPEDTSLYFLSATYCPIRVFSFTPGVLAPGKMTRDVIREIDEKRPRYLLWSNRVFPEFRTPVFGEDFDVEVGAYLKSHYRAGARLLPGAPASAWDWTAVVWERKPEGDTK
jgi:hypothetical protein